MDEFIDGTVPKENSQLHRDLVTAWEFLEHWQQVLSEANAEARLPEFRQAAQALCTQLAAEPQL